MEQQVLIVGSGAMACMFAARLAQAGISVRMLGNWKAGLEALQHGVCLEIAGRNRRYPVAAGAELAPCAGAELALVLVKSWQSRRAAQQLAEVLAPGGLALTLQNGLYGRETLAGNLGWERAAAGITTMGATLIAPGCVRPTAGGEIVLGAHSRLKPLLELFTQAGLPARVEPDLKSLLWGKLLVNAAINPLTALLRVPNGALLEMPQARKLLVSLAREGEAVARAAGVRLPYEDTLSEVERVIRNTAGNQSSMLQDVLRGTPTEIEAITGVLLREAERRGVPVPVNQAVYRMLKSA